MSRSKHRDCPVQQKEITSAECVALRCAEFGCPGSCPFNPWGDAAFPAAFLPLENKVKIWALKKFPPPGSHPGQRTTSTGSLGREMDAFCEAIHTVHVGDGTRPSPLAHLVEKFPRELRKDERILLEYQDQAMPMLFEFHQVIDDTGIVAVDLLDPDRPSFVFRDSGMAERMPRFQLLLGWAYHTPWFTRPFGLLTPMSWSFSHTPMDVITLLAEARGWIPSQLPLRDWLRLNIRDVLLSLDAWHEINVRAARDDSPPESIKKDVAGAEFVPDNVIDAWSPPPMLDRQAAATDMPADNLVLQPGDRGFATTPNMFLGGRTPLEASAQPELRDLIANYLKCEIHRADSRYARTGRGPLPDFSPVLKELGFGDLDFPAPPMTADLGDLRLAESDPEEDYLDDDEFAGELANITRLANAGLPPMPPHALIDELTLQNRVAAAFMKYPQPGNVIAIIRKNWGEFCDVIHASLNSNGYDERSPEHAMSLTCFGILSMIMFPDLKRPPDFDPDRLIRALTGYSAELHHLIKTAEEDDILVVLDDLADTSPQPVVAGFLTMQCLKLTANAKDPHGDLPINNELVPVIIIGLLAALHEMCYLKG